MAPFPDDAAADAAPLSDPSFSIAIGPPSFFNTLGLPDSTVGSYDASTSTIAVKVGCTATLTINATFQKAGTYRCALVLTSTSGAGWTANPFPAQEIIVPTEVSGAAPAKASPTANFLPAAGAGTATYDYTIANAAGPATGHAVPITVTVMP